MKHQLRQELKALSINIVPAAPSDWDMENINLINEQEGTNKSGTVFLVEIDLEGDIPATATAVDLYLNEYKVRKYYQTTGGIGFKVYNPRFLLKHSNKNIRFVINNDEVIETGLKFPVYEALNSVPSHLDLLGMRGIGSSRREADAGTGAGAELEVEV